MNDFARPNSLKILVVTEDRVLQRQLSKFFETVGYDGLQATSSPQARAAVAAANPQILLIDADVAAAGDWELCRQLSQRSANATFRILLVDEPDESQLADALEAGIEDFLVKPVSYGELLARLRAAARVLEYDRRVARQGRLDPLTGLLSQATFTGHLRRQLSENGTSPPRVGCVVLDVDFFGRAARQHGEAAADALAQAIAQELNQLRSSTEVLGRLDTDRFCVMLPGASEDEAVEWAENAREVLAERAFQLGDATVRITISLGAAGSEPGQRAETLLDQATEAMRCAKKSGRNCVIAWNERDADDKALEPDELFGRTVVRDVMTPCTVTLDGDETVAGALALFGRTRLDGVPVVDAKGKLAGVCLETDLAAVAETDYASRTVGEVMTTPVKTFAESDSLASLMEYFNGDSESLVMVVDAGRPVGFVTCNSLVALSRPVQAGSLVAASEYSDTSRYLQVQDVRPLEAEAAV